MVSRIIHALPCQPADDAIQNVHLKGIFKMGLNSYRSVFVFTKLGKIWFRPRQRRIREKNRISEVVNPKFALTDFPYDAHDEETTLKERSD
jgi:hypothetical protein